MKKQPVKVFMCGFDDRSHKSFEIFFTNMCHGEYIISDNRESPIAIVDVDVARGMKALDDLRSRSADQIILAISILEHDSEDQRILHNRKPLNHKMLKRQLAKIKKAIATNAFADLKPTSKPVEQKTIATKKEHYAVDSVPPKVVKNAKSHSTAAATLMTLPDDLNFVGNKKDVNLANSQVIAEISYSPRQRYQGAVAKAVNHATKTGKITEMICLNIGIVINPGESTIATTAGDNLLRPICLLPVDVIDSLVECEVEYGGSGTLRQTDKPRQNLKHCSIEAFIWKVALWSSRGCIAEGLDIHTPVYLSKWPNFTRLENFPHAMRIAALLFQKAIMPAEIGRLLDIPQRYVFSFISASQALGYIRISKRRIDNTMEAEIVQKKAVPRSMLRKLLGRLVGTPDNQTRAS